MGKQSRSADDTHTPPLPGFTLGVTRLRDGKKSPGMQGHHGIQVSGGQQVLVNNFWIGARWIHDLSVDGMQASVRVGGARREPCW